jgi:hypothetical protein
MYERKTALQINHVTPHFAKPLLCAVPILSVVGHHLIFKVSLSCQT